MDETTLHHGAKDRPEHYAPAKVEGAFAPAVWVEKDINTGFATYPKRNQGAKEDCVEYAIAKMIAVDNMNYGNPYRELSPDSLYAFTVEPGGGSLSLLAFAKANEIGLTLDSFYPSDELTEEQAEIGAGYTADGRKVALVYRPPNAQPNICPANIENIALILQIAKQQGKRMVIPITLIGTNNGTWYSSMPTPPASLPDANGNDSAGRAVWYHKVVITDFGLINGKKVLSFDNSWGNGIGIGGQQFLDESYEPYMYGAMYI